MSGEKAPLLGGKGGDSKNFYFLGADADKAKGAEIPSIEVMNTQRIEGASSGDADGARTWFGTLSANLKNMFGGAGPSSGTVKPRKLPIKVEPKVFFANERTFLAWLHMSVTLASISVAIVAFAEQNEWSQIYGLMLMPVAIAFCGYSLYVYIKRAAMIRRKDPGPYEDRVGPIVLATMLGLAIIGNFVVKIIDISK